MASRDAPLPLKTVSRGTLRTKNGPVSVFMEAGEVALPLQLHKAGEPTWYRGRDHPSPLKPPWLRAGYQLLFFAGVGWGEPASQPAGSPPALRCRRRHRTGFCSE